MLTKETVNVIKKKILKNMKAYSIKPKEYDVFISKNIDYEFSKAIKDENSIEKTVIYDDFYNPEKEKDFSVVYDDFVGKNDALNINNSNENKKFYIYIDNNKRKNTHHIFKKILYGIIYDYKMLNIFRKYSLFGVFISLLSLFVKTIFLGIVGAFDVISYYLYKLFVFLLKKRKKILFLPISIVKIIINAINNICILFNNIFINNIDGFVSFVKNTQLEHSSKKNFSDNAKVDRYSKSEEQKKILARVKEKRLELLRELLSQSKDYTKNINFSRPVVKKIKSNEINNPLLKEQISELEQQQKLDLKKEIISERISRKVKKVKDKNDLFVNRIESINNSLLKIANKDKKLYKLLIKKYGDISLSI